MGAWWAIAFLKSLIITAFCWKFLRPYDFKDGFWVSRCRQMRFPYRLDNRFIQKFSEGREEKSLGWFEFVANFDFDLYWRRCLSSWSKNKSPEFHQSNRLVIEERTWLTDWRRVVSKTAIWTQSAADNSWIWIINVEITNSYRDETFSLVSFSQRPRGFTKVNGTGGQ